MPFTKRETKFMDWLDAVVEAELDLETTIQNGEKMKVLTADFKRMKKIRKEFFEWFKKTTE